MNEETATTEQTEQGPEVRRLDNQIQQLCKQVTESDAEGERPTGRNCVTLNANIRTVGNELGKIEAPARQDRVRVREGIDRA